MILDHRYNVDHRIIILKKLLFEIESHHDEIVQALYDDFRKPAFEAVITETQYVISDLKSTIRNLKRWSRPKRVWPSILNFPSLDYIYTEPYGNVLIISPWNYPFQLALCPVIAAIAAGNRITLKPSELTPHTTEILSKIIIQAMLPSVVNVVQGGPEIATELLQKKWDYIFFTGSVAVGKIVAKAAAVHLTPTTLELGGKNPCIIHPSADMELSARRIIWGKFLNAGQTCIAPDYLLVHRDDKQKMISCLKREIIRAFGENPKESVDYARIINLRNWERIYEMIDPEDVLHGGQSDQDSLYIAPTLIDQNDLDSKIMDSEIFGPLLPIISYVIDDDIEYIVAKYQKPLALYVFTSKISYAERVIQKMPFGGGCINDTIIHFSNKRLPFGGVGESGMGAYHGKKSYELFSHKKSIVRKATWLDIPLRYAPYGNKVAFVKKWLGKF